MPSGPTAILLSVAATRLMQTIMFMRITAEMPAVARAWVCACREARRTPWARREVAKKGRESVGPGLGGGEPKSG